MLAFDRRAISRRYRIGRFEAYLRNNFADFS
jgi:hypothetical protein